MGCGGSKVEEEGIQAPLDHWMEKLDIETLDELFAGASKTIEQVEETRELVVDKRDELILSSGACSYMAPKIQHSFYGICWKLSADNKGKFIDCEIGLDVGEDVSLKLSGKNNSAEAVNAFNQFNDFMKGIAGLPEKMKEISDNVVQLSKDITENPSAILDQIKAAVTDDPFKAMAVIKKATANIDKVKKLVMITPKIVEELTLTMGFLMEIPAFLKDLDKLKVVDEIGAKANKHKYVKSHDITWHLMEDKKERFGTKPQHGVKYCEERKDAKKVMKEKIKNKKK